jgi:hypothetical protein
MISPLAPWLLLAGAAGAPTALSVPTLPGEQWSAVLGEDAFEHDYGAAALSPSGELVIAVKARAAGAVDTPWRLSLWTVGSTGRKLREIELELPGVNLHDPLIRSLLLLEGGEALLAGELEGGEASVVRVAQDGKSSRIWRGGDARLGTSISKLVLVKDGILLLGGRAQDAYIAKVTLAGKLLWERSVDRGKVETFVDGLATEDGGAVVVGTSWNGDAFHVGPSAVWLARYDGNGVLRQGSEQTFPGRYPTLSRSADGKLAVAYDRSSTTAQEIAVRAFGPKTMKAPVFDAGLAIVSRGLAQFRIVTVKDGGFVAVGSQDFALQVSKLTPTGTTLWSFLDSKRRATDFDVVASSDHTEFYIVYPALSTFMAGERRVVNTKIGLLKFAAK